MTWHTVEKAREAVRLAAVTSAVVVWVVLVGAAALALAAALGQ
jgi:hypothetical protein